MTGHGPRLAAGGGPGVSAASVASVADGPVIELAFVQAAYRHALAATLAAAQLDPVEDFLG